MSPLAGQMFHRAALFGAFGSSKRWLTTNADGSSRPLTTADVYKVQLSMPAIHVRLVDDMTCHAQLAWAGMHQHLTKHQHGGMQAGAITGLTASFTEGPIDFYKSQVQYQIIKTQTEPSYKRRPS